MVISTLTASEVFESVNVVKSMMVAMATIIQAVCRSDHDLSDDIKCALVIEQFGCSDIFILIRNVLNVYLHNIQV